MKTDKYGYTIEHYRNALDELELAVSELGIAELVRGWGEPRHRSELKASIPTRCGIIYRLYDAYMQANEIMNSESP